MRTYQAELVRQIPIGTNPGELNHWTGPGMSMRPSAPVVYEDRIYIMDNANGRLNIYDKDLRFVDELRPRDTKVNMRDTYYFSVLDDGGIIAFSVFGGYRSDRDGRLIYSVDADRLPEHVTYQGYFWTFHDYVIFLDRSDGGDYHVIDGEGRFLSPGEIKSLGEEMKRDSRLRRESPRMRDAIDGFLKENNLLLDGERDFLVTSWRGILYRQFYRLIAANSDRPIQNRVADAEYEQEGGGVNGVDIDGNTYWGLINVKTQKKLRYVISPRGDVIDYFAIAPEARRVGDCCSYTYGADGRFYALDYNIENRSYDIYRVAGDWLKYTTSRPLTPTSLSVSVIPRLTSLAASSTLTEPFDLNAYHPVKVLDGKPDIAWMEAVDGPGIGEWWQMALDRPVTVDEIRIGPGYLGEPWWNQNNRIRQIDLVLDDDSTIRYFSDAMEMQSIKLSRPATFQTLKIVIEAVYPTTHWDDTPLAEVELWYQGEQIELDISEFSDHLQVDAGP